MKRILVGVDGSETSERAVRFAAALAAPAGAEVTVAYAVAPLMVAGDLGGASLTVTQEYEKEMRQYGEVVVKRAVSTVESLGARAKSTVLLGAPASALVDEAERELADLVVVGSRGLGPVKRMLLGSVSDRVVHACSRPTLVVH